MKPQSGALQICSHFLHYRFIPFSPFKSKTLIILDLQTGLNFPLTQIIKRKTLVSKFKNEH